MKLDIVRNARRNVIAEVMNRILTFFLPVVNRTIFIWIIGAEYLGLNGLFTSVLGALSLAELGFGQAVVYAMYKPVAEDDRRTLCAYYAFYRVVFRIVGCLILLSGLALLPFLPKLVHGDVPADISLTVVYLIHLANSVISFFLFAYKGVLLTVHQRLDVETHIDTVVKISQNVGSLLVLCLTRNYYYYVLATIVFTVMKNILTASAAKRLFPDVVCAGRLSREQKMKLVRDVGSIFLHRIGKVIATCLDNIVVSSFLGLVSVAVYGNYYAVYKMVTGFVDIIFYSLVPGFGNAIRTETKAEVWEKFRKANGFAMVAVAWCSAMMLALYQPFMALWTGGRPELMRPISTALLMVVSFYVCNSRQGILAIKDALGLWRPDQLKPVVSGLVNCGVSIALARLIGMDGIILGTILAFAFIEIPWESAVVFRNYLTGGGDAGGRSFLVRYARQQLSFLAFACALCAATWLAATLVPSVPNVFADFALRALAAASVACGLTFAVYRHDLLYILRRVLSR